MTTEKTTANVTETTANDTTATVIKSDGTKKTVKLNSDILKNWKNRVTERSFSESRGTKTEFNEKEFTSRKSTIYRNYAKLAYDLTGKYEFAPQQNYVLIETYFNGDKKKRIPSILPDDKHFFIHYSTPNFSLDVYRVKDNANGTRLNLFKRFDARNEINANEFTTIVSR